MMQHKFTLIQNLLEKSKNALDDANYALNDNRLENANNRIYYSIFYCVAALGYKFDFVTSKHSQLLGWFNKTIIHEKQLFDLKLYQVYKSAYEFRMKSDYEYTYKPVKEHTQLLYNEAEKLIEQVQDYIKNNA